MKREVTFLIALSLIVNSSQVSSQEFQTSEPKPIGSLMNDAQPAPAPMQEVQESAPNASATEAPAATEEVGTAEVKTEGVASEAPTTTEAPLVNNTVNTDFEAETIDIQNLESLDSLPEEKVAEPKETVEPSQIVEETPEGPAPETLEPLESPSSETAAKDTDSTGDELEALKKDIGDSDEFIPATSDSPEEIAKAEAKKEEAKANQIVKKEEPAPVVFDVGREERELLSMASSIQGQISDNEWNEVATASKVESYTVVKNDWLFKISKKLFGSGFFYPKIWSLNSYITNPHFIEPGMLLSFTTGSGANPPQVKLGSFTNDELNAAPGSLGTTNPDDLANFGDDATPKWLEDKEQLSKQGVYFQYASEETMEDLAKAGEQALNREYENYEPPASEFDVIVPSNYDKTGFDKTSRIFYSFKEGFYLSTFVSTNIVQDFGEVVNGPDENIFFVSKDRAYVKFDETINALPGDRYSVYSSMGKAKTDNSDREGYKYAIIGQIRLIKKIKDKWEVQFIEVSGTPQRGDRITTYTPKIQRITRTYNSRMVEAAILSTYNARQAILGYGDVVYLDRGRADGVEMGNVFEVYGFKDRHLKENITDQPTYKTGELTVITITDNFATALVTKSERDFSVGDVAITKTKESHLRESSARDASVGSKKELMGGKALEELDVELNLENLNDDLLKQADKIQLTEDELAELERQEREKSVIKDSEKDLKSLERLENEIEQAEKILNDAKIDEDKLLENENLNDVEKKQGSIDQESLDDIEENLGKRYVDEDLNSKDNPFGLTEFDVEEVDELLNTEKNQEKK